MADNLPASAPAPAPGPIKAAINRFLKIRSATALAPAERQMPGLERTRDDWGDGWGEDSSSSFLYGAGTRTLRNRLTIYEYWQRMLSDPIIQTGLRLHVTSALGGHESKGQMVFIEATPEAKKNPQLEALVKEIAEDLTAMLDKIAPTVAFNAVSFGDAYVRMYSDPKVGMRDLYVDEMIYPPLVQPYERGNSTVGYVVATGLKSKERLTVVQVARMKLARMMYVPQDRVIEKAARTALTTDSIDELPAVPGMVGGSFLDGAELPWQRFNAAWSGLTGQRVQASINESFVAVQQEGMTKEQSKRFRDRLKALYEARNSFVTSVVAQGQAIYQAMIHFIPVHTEKQMVRLESSGPSSGAQGQTFSVDDVMMDARLLAGALGHDLSMLGFSDQLSGGLGDGGFFRVSAQAAERARAIRSALIECFDHIISVHLLMKHGMSFDGQKKPWEVQFYSGISALETERQKTKLDAMNSGSIMVQMFTQLRDLGLDEKAMKHFLEREAGADAVDADLYAKAIKSAKPPEPPGGGFGGGGDPFGGGGGMDELPGGDEKQAPAPGAAASEG